MTLPPLARMSVAAVLVGCSLSGCASDDRPSALVIDLIDEAIAAVEERFGGEVSFYEINATSDGVNLFVSTQNAESTPAVVQARYTSDGELVVAEEPVPAQGAVFDGSAVEFDPRTILERAVGQLSSSTPQVFIITASASSSAPTSDTDNGITYRLVMESQRGGRLIVLLGRDGSILGSDVVD